MSENQDLEKDQVQNEEIQIEENQAEKIQNDIDSELADFAPVQEEGESFLPEVNEAELEMEALPTTESVEGTELDSYESAEIEDVEFIEEERLDSILESILFASDRPVSLNSIKMVFKGTNIRTDKIKRALDRLAIELAGARRGVSLEEVPGGYQLRTKVDNMQFLQRTLKARPFRLSGPALEVLAIVAYKQPLIKSEIDEIRGVESGHLLRALMEKNLVTFEGKSDLPGKPMQYGTTKKFLETFSLRNLKELPSISQIDELLPEGIGDEAPEKPTLSQITDSMSQQAGTSYSEGEEELNKITTALEDISASSEFFEQEKLRQKQKREAERAQSIREAIMVGEEVSNRDKNWLARYDEAQMLGQKMADFDSDADVKQASTDTAPAAEETLTEESEQLGISESEVLFADEEPLFDHEANDLADIEK